MPNPEEILLKAKEIRLIALDVDGVLTDGGIGFLSNGDEIKFFNAKDGQGLAMASRAGIPVALITARQSVMNERRAAELGIAYVFQNAKKKLPVLENLLLELNLTAQQVAYMGDDLPDIPVLEAVGLPSCPADAVIEVQTVCRNGFIAPHLGGQGAVRALIDLILQARQEPITLSPP